MHTCFAHIFCTDFLRGFIVMIFERIVARIFCADFLGCPEQEGVVESLQELGGGWGGGAPMDELAIPVD